MTAIAGGPNSNFMSQSCTSDLNLRNDQERSLLSNFLLLGVTRKKRSWRQLEIAQCYWPQKSFSGG